MLHHRELIWLLAVAPALSNSKSLGSRVFDASGEPNHSSAKENFVRQNGYVSVAEKKGRKTRVAPPSWPHGNLSQSQAGSPSSHHSSRIPNTILPTQSIVSAPSFQPLPSSAVLTAFSTFTTPTTSSAFDSSALSYSVEAPPQDYPTFLPTNQEDPDLDTGKQVDVRARGWPILLMPVLFALLILLLGMYRVIRVCLATRTQHSSTSIAVEPPKVPDLLNPVEIARVQNIEKERAPLNDHFFGTRNILHDLNDRTALISFRQHRKDRMDALSTFFTTTWQKIFKFRSVSSPPNGNDIECATVSDRAGPTVAMDPTPRNERGQPISETQSKTTHGKTPSNAADPLHPMAISEDAASGSAYIVRDVLNAASRGSSPGSSTSIRSDGQVLRSSPTSDVFNPRLSRSSIHSITNPLQNPSCPFLPPPELRGPNLPKDLQDENLDISAASLPSDNVKHIKSDSCTSSLIGTFPESLNRSTAVTTATRTSQTLLDCTNTVVSSDSIASSSYAPLLDEFPSVPSQVQVGNRGSGGALTGISSNGSRIKTSIIGSAKGPQDENFSRSPC